MCLRGGATEVEVAYQFLESPDDVVSTSFTLDDAERLEAELSAARSPASEPATSVRRRASSRAPTVPRSTSCAPGRAFRSRPRDSLAACASRRSATSTGTCRRSKRCSRTSSARASTRSSSRATASAGRGLPRSSTCSTPSSARIVRGNADRAEEVARFSGELASWNAARLGASRLEPVLAWPLTLELRIEGLGAVLVCHSTPTVGHADLHADHAGRRAPGGARPGRQRTSFSAGTRTCSTTARSRADFGSSIREASACRTRACAARTGPLLGPGRRVPANRVRRRGLRRGRYEVMGAPIDEQQLGVPSRSARRRPTSTEHFESLRAA